MKIITANSLQTGAPIYWLGAGRWTPRLDEALLLAPDTAAAALAEAESDAQSAVGAYLVTLEEAGAPAKRERLREAIRASGPSVAFGRPAAGSQ